MVFYFILIITFKEEIGSFYFKMSILIAQQKLLFKLMINVLMAFKVYEVLHRFFPRKILLGTTQDKNFKKSTPYTLLVSCGLY